MRINQDLFGKIQKKLDVKKARVYEVIASEADRLFIDNATAALRVASQLGIGFRRYATKEQLDALQRATTSSGSAGVAGPAVQPTSTRRREAVKRTKARAKAPGKHVFVVHGRDERLRKSMFDFCTSVGLKPMEWDDAIKLTHEAAPYVGRVLEKALAKVSAVIVLMTPDDEACLKKEHRQKTDESYERKPTGQARQNVIFEAGMALAMHSKRTILVEIGKCRPFTDIVGRLSVRIDNSLPKRRTLATRLLSAGCDVNLDGEDWKSAGDFSPPK